MAQSTAPLCTCIGSFLYLFLFWLDLHPIYQDKSLSRKVALFWDHQADTIQILEFKIQKSQSQMTIIKCIDYIVIHAKEQRVNIRLVT
jgi:hypothetical protein